MSRCDEYKRESQTPRALKLSSALLRLRLSSLLLELPFSIDCPSPGGSTYSSLVALLLNGHIIIYSESKDASSSCI